MWTVWFQQSRPMGPHFLVKQKQKKNYGLSKTFAPKPTRTMKCIGMYNSIFFELYMYNSIFFELYMYKSIFSSYTCITPFFVRYIPKHFYTFYIFLFLNLPFGKRLHFSSFHGWVLNCIFFRYRFSEIKIVILENQPTAYLPFLFFFLLPFWPIWNFFPSLPCWSWFLAWSSILIIGFKTL